MNLPRTLLTSLLATSISFHCLAATTSASMYAIQFHPSGSSGALQYDEDVPRPVPGPYEVLIRVTAAGLNPTDAEDRARVTQRAYIPGYDIAGEIVAVGGNELTVISSLIEKNAVRPTVSQTFPLRDAAQAQEALRTGHGQGKIVLIVASGNDSST